jgi:hypothetical protein
MDDVTGYGVVIDGTDFTHATFIGVKADDEFMRYLASSKQF